MKYPAHCCQKCGEEVGYVGRFLAALSINTHICQPKRAWTVDRDGKVKTEKHRPVVLKAKK